MQTFQVAALALPVADREVHELQLRNISEVGNRKHRLKHCLQAAIFALAGQFVHLQEAVIRTLLNLDQVRNLDGCWNLGKIETLAVYIVLCHAQELLLSGSLGLQYKRNEAAKSGATLLLNETASANGRSARKKARGSRKDKLVRGRHLRRLLLSNL